MSASARLDLARLLEAAARNGLAAAVIYTLFERSGSAVLAVVPLFVMCLITVFAGPLAAAHVDRARPMLLWRAGALVQAALLVPAALVDATAVTAALVLVGMPAMIVATPSVAAYVNAGPDPAGEVERSVIWQTVGLVCGPFLAGFALDRAGLGIVLGAIAATLVMCALLPARRARPSDAVDDDGAPPPLAPWVGITLLWRSRTLRAATILTAAAWLVLSCSTPVEVVLPETFGTGSTGYGTLLAVFGVGSVLGSVVAPRLLPAEPRTGLRVVLAALGASLIAIAIAPTWVLALCGVAVLGLAEGALACAEQSLVVRYAPEDAVARVSAALESATVLATAAPLLLAGGAATAFGGQELLGAVGAATLAVALPLMVLARVRTSGDTEPAPVGAPPG